MKSQDDFPLRGEVLEKLDKARQLPTKDSRWNAIRRILNQYETRMEQVGPMPYDLKFISVALDEIEKLREPERTKTARWWFCWQLDGVAWLNNAHVLSYLQFVLENGDYANPDYPLKRLAEMAHPPGPDGVRRELSKRVVREWFEEYELPHIDDIDLSKRWFTDQELVVIARTFPGSGMPTTLRSLRRKSKKEGWGKKGLARRRNSD